MASNGESPLFSRIVRETEDATKGKDAARRDTLRLLRAALHNREIEKRGKGDTSPLTDEETLEVIRREVKKRKEALEIYTKGGRPELAEKEWNENVVLEVYLPPQATNEDIARAVEEVVSAYGAPTEKEFGKIMGEVMKRMKGTAEAARVSELVRKALGK